MVTRERPSVERRAQLVDAGDGVDRGLDAVGDLGLDALRRRAGVGRRDRHDRHLDARVAIDAEREERHAADDRQRRDQHRGEDRDAGRRFQRASAWARLRGRRRRGGGRRPARWSLRRRRRASAEVRGGDPLAFLRRPRRSGWCRRPGARPAARRAAARGSPCRRRTRGTSSCSRPRSPPRAARAASASVRPWSIVATANMPGLEHGVGVRHARLDDEASATPARSPGSPR